MKLIQQDLLELATDLGLVIDTVNARVILADRLYAGHNDWVYGDLEGKHDDRVYKLAKAALAAYRGGK